MRVGVYTECLLNSYTGVEWQTHFLVDGLSKRVDLVCFHSKSVKHPSFGVKHFNFMRPLSIPFYPVFSALFRSSCFERVDVLHVPYPKFPYFRKPKIPVVVTVHDIIPFLFPEFHNWKRIVYFKFFLPFYFKNVDAFIAVSQSTKNDLVKYYRVPESKISVVHDCISEIKYEKVRKDDFILYLGTLEPRKNVEGVIRAFAILKSRGFKHKLIIAGGRGWKFSKIFSLVKKLNLENEVVFKGYVSGEEKAELYRKAKLFVWPSFYEGFGLPVLEAMAYGTPVVTSNVSSLPEVCGDSAFLVNPHSVQDIAGAMIHILSSTKLYNGLVQKGLERVKLFTQKRMIDGVLSVYKQL